MRPLTVRECLAAGFVLVSTSTLFLCVSPESISSAQEKFNNYLALNVDSTAQDAFSFECDVDTEPKQVQITLDGASAGYRLFHPPPPSPSPVSLRPLEQTPSLPDRCIEDWVAHGRACLDPDALADAKFDFIWTWSNGSEPLHRRAVRQYELDTLPRSAKFRTFANEPWKLKLFREHDEFRHSLRSVLQHFRPHIGRVHLVTGDFALPDPKEAVPVPNNEDEPLCYREGVDGAARLGQIPTWIDTDAKDGNVSINVVHHAEFFGNYRDTSFNSLAIESQFANIRDVDDFFIYMNDDFFFSNDLIAADWYTPTFGQVFRIYPQRVIAPSSWEGENTSNKAAETVALEWTSEVIGRRFGYRSFPYSSHSSKIVSRALLRELAATFPEAIADSGAARVRSLAGTRVRNIHMMALYAHYVIERHREALLWSWAVARLGQHQEDENDGLGWAERAWLDVGGKEDGAKIVIRRKARKTLSVANLLGTLGPNAQRVFQGYNFASADGYGYAPLGESGIGGWPDPRTDSDKTCSVLRSQCWPSADDLAVGYTREDFFKHIAFTRPDTCGDCILAALVSASGDRGFSAILPHRNGTDAEEALEGDGEHSELDAAAEEPPHLPLTSEWRDADFSIEANVPNGADLRRWSTRLIHRYRHVIGRVMSQFSMLSEPVQAQKEFKRLDGEMSRAPPLGTGIVCINDDIVKGARKIDNLFRSWQERHWPTPAAWERDQ